MCTPFIPHYRHPLPPTTAGLSSKDDPVLIPVRRISVGLGSCPHTYRAVFKDDSKVRLHQHMYAALVRKEEGTPMNIRIHDVRAVRGHTIEFTITDRRSTIGMLQVHAAHVNMDVVRRATQITLEPESLDDDAPHPPPRPFLTRLMAALGLCAASSHPKPPYALCVRVNSVAYAGWPSTLRVIHADQPIAIGDTVTLCRRAGDPHEEATIHRVRVLGDGWMEYSAYAHSRATTVYLLHAGYPPLPSYAPIISKIHRIKRKLTRLLMFDKLFPIFQRTRT